MYNDSKASMSEWFPLIAVFIVTRIGMAKTEVLGLETWWRRRFAVRNKSQAVRVKLHSYSFTRASLRDSTFV